MAFFLILAMTSYYAAQATSSAAVAQLTGPTSKVWTETAIDVTLGRDRSCTEGREYVFAADSTGALRECRSQELVETSFLWTHRSDGIDDFIDFNNQEYRLIISDGTDPRSGLEYEEAVLRAERIRSTETIDIVLQRFP